MCRVTALTETTWTSIRQLFPPELHSAVAEILEQECGNNLPLLENADAPALDRYRLAALTLSQGSLAGLRQAVDLAKTDWRDLLVAAAAADAPAANRRSGFRRRPRKSGPEQEHP
jgi:hypothetical protein